MTEIGYVIKDAKKWEVDPERTASEFDSGYYRGLLEKAWLEERLCSRKPPGRHYHEMFLRGARQACQALKKEDCVYGHRFDELAMKHSRLIVVLNPFHILIISAFSGSSPLHFTL